MKLKALSKKEISQINVYLTKELHAYTVILFGSASKGVLRDDSDVDIAFLSDQSFSAYELFIKAGELADLLGREVDLIDFEKASTVFKAQIVGSGAIILDNEPLKRQYAFMRALKAYAMLNDERKDILIKLGYQGEGGFNFDTRCDDEQDRKHQTLHSKNT